MKNGVDCMGIIDEVRVQQILSENYIYVLGAFGLIVLLFIIMMIYYKVRVKRLEQYIDYLKDKIKTVSDVEQIAKKIGDDLANGEKRTANFEDEQENKAIISYQELLKKEKAFDPYAKPEIKVSTITDEKPPEPIKVVPDIIREQAIKEKPVVYQNQEFLNSLKDLRTKLK